MAISSTPITATSSSEAVPEAIALQLDLERIGALEQLFLLPGSGG